MTNQIHAADCRRATALACHYGRANIDGVNALFKETVEVGRVTELLMALIGLYAHIVPVLVTKLGMRCLSEVVVNVATKGKDDDDRRAARLVMAHSLGDVDGMNAVLNEAKAAEAITGLFMSLMALYCMIVPALRTDVGLDALQAAVLDIAALEAETEVNE